MLSTQESKPCRIGRIAYAVNMWADRVCVVLLAGAGLTVLMQVMLRYVFHTGFSWSEELARYMVIYVSLIGSSIVIGGDGHPRIEILIEMLPMKSRRYTELTLNLLVFAFLCVLTWQGVESTVFGLNTRTPALQMPWAWAYVSIPVGGILMAIQVLCRMIESFSP